MSRFLPFIRRLRPFSTSTTPSGPISLRPSIWSYAYVKQQIAELRAHPGSSLTAFMLLHELTALVPIPVFYWIITTTGVQVPIPEEAVRDAGNRMAKMLKKFGLKGLEPLEPTQEAGAGAMSASEDGANSTAVQSARFLMDLGTSYAIVKALMPARVAVSLLLTPWFSRVVNTSKFSGETSVHEACKEIREKFWDGAGGSDHGLFWPETGKWLVTNKVLDFYDLKAGDALEYKKKHRILKVRTMDESVKQVLVDESQPVSALVKAVCEKIGLQNPEEYSFVPDAPATPTTPIGKSSATATSPLKLISPSGKKAATEDEARWLNPEITLREQGLTDADGVILKKKFFFTDQNIDRNDPVQLNLLYNQTKEMIVSGKHPSTIEEAAQFAAIQSQIQFGNHEPDKHKPGLKDFVPPEYRANRDLPKKIAAEHAKLQGLTELNAKFRYVLLSRSLKTYGITFFAVKEKHPKKNKMVDILLGVTKQSVVRVDIDTKDIMKEWKLTQLKRWAPNANSFTMDFGSYEESYYTVQTTEGEQISQQIGGYIDIILKKKKEAEKVVHEEVEEHTAVEEYIKPGKAISVGLSSPAKSQAVESKVGTVMTANSTRAGYARGSSQFQTAQFGSPVAYAQTAEISGAQQTLLQSIRNGLAVVMSAGADLEVGIQLPPIGTDAASLQWKQQTIDSSAESVSSQIASHLAAVGSIVNNATGNIEMMDYEILGSNVNVITSNLSHMSNGLKMLSALTADGSDKESLLEAARNLAKATSNYLEAIQPVIMGQASKDQIYGSGRDVAVMASDLLTLIGRLDVSEDSQNELIDAARLVARAVADLVGNARKVADSMGNQDDEYAVAADAKSLAEAANQLVACTTVVSPAVTIQLCLDQLMESSVIIKDALGKLAESSEPCTNTRFQQAMVESVQKVEEAIAKLIEKASRNASQLEADPLDVDYQQVVVSIDGMLKNSETTEGVIASAKNLTLSATQLVNSLKRAGLEKGDDDERDRLLMAAKALADATSRMVGAAKETARYPVDPDRRLRLETAVHEVQGMATSACGPKLQYNALQRLNKAVKDSLTSQNQLILASRNAAASNRNQASQIMLNQSIKRMADITPIVASAMKTHTYSPTDVVAQSNLIAAAKQLLPATESLVSAAKTAAPTAGEAASQTHLLNLAKLAANDVEHLEKVVLMAEEVSSGLRLESALCIAESMQVELEGSIVDLQQVGSIALAIQEPYTTETAHVKLASLAKDIQSSIAAMAIASSSGNERTTGFAASSAITALQSMVYAAGSLKGTSMDSEMHLSMKNAASGVATTLASLIAAAKVALAKGEGSAGALDALAQSAHEAVGQVVLCLPGQRDLDAALKTMDTAMAKLRSEKLTGVQNVETYVSAQTKLQATASAVAMAANALNSASRGSLIELQNGANAFGLAFEKVLNAVVSFSQACGDAAVAERLLAVAEALNESSVALVKASKASAADVADLNAARSVGDTLNSLVDVCSASAPGHAECNNSLRILVSAFTRLDSVNDGSVASNTFSESVGRLTDSSKQLSSLLNSILTAARSGSIQKMAQDIVVAAQTTVPLTENNVRAVYLIGISDPTSVPAVPPVVNQSSLSTAGYDIKEATKKLVDPSNSQQQILEIAATIAKNTSNLCNACKVAGINASISQAAKQTFISSAKDVAMKTSTVVASIKQLAVGLNDEARKKAAVACLPLIEAIDKLVQFSLSPEFAGVPAKVSQSALAAQKPLIDLNRAVLSSFQDVVNTAKLLCSNPKDQTSVQLLSTESKTVTECIQNLISGVINGAPGYKECNDALHKITENISLIDAAIMDATVNNLIPAPGAYKEVLVETARALASLSDIIARSATSDIGHLGSSVAELPGNFKQVRQLLTTFPFPHAKCNHQCIAWAIGVASNSPDMTTQITILNDTKHLSDCIQSFMSAVKQYTGNPNEAGAVKVTSERASVRAAANKLVTTLEGSRDDSGEFSKAVEKIEGLISTLETRIPMKASQPYQINASDLESLGKSLVERVGDVITKAKTPEKFREYAGKSCDTYESIVGTACSAIAGTDDGKVKQGLMDAVRQLGGSTIRLCEAMRLASAKSAADHASRLKLGQAGRDVSSNVSNLIAAAKEGSKGIMICQEAIGSINDILTDLESTLIFAQAGNLDPVDAKDAFSKHKDNLLTSAKSLTESVKSFIAAVTGSQETLGQVATQSVKVLDVLKDTARMGAISVTSGDKHMQQQLLGAARLVGENLQNLIAAAARAHGKPPNDPSMSDLGDSVKAEFSSLAELVRVTKLLADESLRGQRSIDGAITSIDETLIVLASDEPAQGTALPDEVASLAKQLATTAAALVSASSGKQDELVAASNSIRKQVADLSRAGKAATDKAPEDKKLGVMDSIKTAASSIKGLLASVKTSQGNGGDSKQLLQNAARSVAMAVNDVVTSAEALIPGGYVDPKDPNVIAERELLNAASAIEAAAKKLATMKPPERPKEANAELNFDEQIFEATKAIAAASAALVRSATGAQREIVAKEKVNSYKSEVYFSDGTWSEGLVSAAKLVAGATADLCEAANQAVKGNIQRERVIVSAKSVSASTAQLILAATAKTDSNSQAQIRLRAAGKGVTNATNQLVKVAEDSAAFNETEQITATAQGPGGMTSARVLEMEAQVSILKMEKELEKARAKLAAVPPVQAMPATASLNSLFSNKDVQSILTEDFIATHVLRAASLLSEEYVSLNNKNIRVEDDVLSTGKGKGDKLFLDDATGKVFTILHLDQPLLPVTDFAEAVMIEDLHKLHDEVKQLVDQVFKIVGALDERLLNPILAANSLTIDTFYQIVETFLMEHSYEMVFFRISKEFRSKDIAITDIIVRIQTLDLEQMGLPVELGKYLGPAVKEFETIAAVRTPFEKIKCLMRSVHLLDASPTSSGPSPSKQSPTSKLVLTSDLLIPLLVLMVVRSNVQNLESSLYYMQRFTFEHDVIAGEFGYALSTLEAVISYISENSELLSDLCRDNEAFLKGVTEGNMDLIRRFIERGGAKEPAVESVLRCRNWEGDNAVLLAAKLKNWEMLKLVLSAGLSVDSQNFEGISSLHICALDGQNELAASLLELGAKVDIRDNKLNTPFQLATSRSSLEMLKLFSSAPHSCDINTQNLSGLSALHLANTAAVTEFLIAIGADPEISNKEGLTPLLYHCQLGRTEIVSCLIRAGADLSVKDLGHRTCLHLCAFRGYADVVRLILETKKSSLGNSGEHASEDQKELQVSAISLRGNTPLHAAAEPGHLEIVRMLLDAGTDVTVQNLSGLVAADLAKDDKVRDILDNHGLFGSMISNVQMPKTGNGERVAGVVRHVFENGEVYFVIKSGQVNNVVIRIKAKVDSLMETITDTYPPVIDNLEAEDIVFKQAELTLTSLQTAITNVGVRARKLAKFRREFAGCLRVVRYHIGRPTGRVYFGTNVKGRGLVSEALRRVGEISSKQSGFDTWDIADMFVESIHGIVGALTSIPRHAILSSEYTKASREASNLSATVGPSWMIPKACEGFLTTFDSAMYAVLPALPAKAAVDDIGEGPSSFYLEAVQRDLEDSDDDVEYSEIPAEEFDDLSESEDGDETLEKASRSVNERSFFGPRPEEPASGLAKRPELIDDFFRNFLASKNEWYELQQKGRLSPEDVSIVPDVLLKNQELADSLQKLRVDVENYKEIASKARSTYDKLRKERDFHRMHHKRVVQEKKGLDGDIKRLKKHFESYEPTLKTLKNRYEVAMKEKMLTKLERDRLATKLQTLDTAVKQGDLKPDVSVLHKAASISKPVKDHHQPGQTYAGARPHAIGKKGQRDAQLPLDDRTNVFISMDLPSAKVDRLKQIHVVRGHDMAISAVKFHPKKMMLATVSDDKTWKVWGFPSGDIIMSGGAHKSWISDCDFHPRGAHLATSSGDGTVRLWDFDDHTQAVWSCAFHDSGDFLVSSSMDHTAKLWDITTGKCRQTFRNHADSVNHVGFIPFTNTVFTGSGDKTLSLWDARTGLCTQTLFGHRNAINNVAVSLRGDTVASADADGTVKFWDIRNVSELEALDFGPHAANKIAFDPSGNILAVASNDGTTKLYNIRDRVRHRDLSCHDDAVQAVAFDRSAEFLVTAGSERQAVQSPHYAPVVKPFLRTPSTASRRASRPASGTEGSETPAISPDELALRRATSRISSLESTIEFLHDQHAEALKGLHAEIQRLQNICSETIMKEVLSGAPSVRSGSGGGRAAAVDGVKRAGTPDGTAVGVARADRKQGDEKPLPKESKEETPYNILLQQQKKKYQVFIERISTDNKRKQHEIDSLKAELELIRDVLALAGLDIDLVELRALVHTKDGSRASASQVFASRAKKLGILPPILADGPTGEGTKEALPSGAVTILDRERAPLSQSLDLPLREAAVNATQAAVAAVCNTDAKVEVVTALSSKSVGTAPERAPMSTSAKLRSHRYHQRQELSSAPHAHRSPPPDYFGSEQHQGMFQQQVPPPRPGVVGESPLDSEAIASLDASVDLRAGVVSPSETSKAAAFLPPLTKTGGKSEATKKKGSKEADEASKSMMLTSWSRRIQGTRILRKKQMEGKQ
ncbi:Talin-1 [Irineochytrium annulatum]|nr:Talin-1 [Irineochytrium annulatum]